MRSVVRHITTRAGIFPTDRKTVVPTSVENRRQFTQHANNPVLQRAKDIVTKQTLQSFFSDRDKRNANMVSPSAWATKTCCTQALRNRTKYEQFRTIHSDAVTTLALHSVKTLSPGASYKRMDWRAIEAANQWYKNRHEVHYPLINVVVTDGLNSAPAINSDTPTNDFTLYESCILLAICFYRGHSLLTECEMTKSFRKGDIYDETIDVNVLITRVQAFIKQGKLIGTYADLMRIVVGLLMDFLTMP